MFSGIRETSGNRPGGTSGCAFGPSRTISLGANILRYFPENMKYYYIKLLFVVTSCNLRVRFQVPEAGIKRGASKHVFVIHLNAVLVVICN